MSQSLLPNIHNFMANIDPFDKLPASVVQEVVSKVKITYLAKGEEIHFNSDTQERFLYVIRTGAVEQRMQDGSLRARLGEEDQFGFTFLDVLAESENGYRAVALTDSLLYMIPHSVLKHFFDEHPEYAEFFDPRAQSRLNSALYHAMPNGKGPYYRKVSTIASENIAIVDKTVSIKAVAKLMQDEMRSSCAVIKDGDDIVGVITDRDMTTRVVAQGIDTQNPITEVMTTNPQLIDGDATVLEAIAMMMQFNIRCLPVVYGQTVIGLITTTHLVHNHQTQALFLIEKIKYSNSIQSLQHLKDERYAIFHSLIESHVNSNIVTSVMSMIMDAFNRRIIQLAEGKLGAAPCDYSWMVAGTHARNEVHLLSVQDSGLIIDDAASSADMAYFTHLAMIVCNGMNTCGYPLGDGRYIAATPKWCQTVSGWKAHYQNWVNRPDDYKEINNNVFLEVRSLHGNSDLVGELQQHLHQCTADNSGFIPSLVKDATATQPPLGIFNNLVLEKSGDNSRTLDIKKHALNLIVDLARIYNLSAHGDFTGTEERFKYAFEHGLMEESTYKNAIGAYLFITQVRFNHQCEALKLDLIPDNHIEPDSFSSFERKHLKDAFKIIHELQETATLRFGAIKH
ncbi:putative nucleotidyltransferase substrate binding domain-containing protein [Vibrio algicola]|uniref:CBS domain-containing protein n=1 Tax=Vibrio algicola TaxID=2662262 RepID=A0A5Q0TKT8_9VIBR|nr:putative nucleotidyltransferase substrate binding domain-containing protein [Vibrio algicola]